MTDILSVTFPFFALVLCGYVAARARLLPLDAVPGLNMFVLYFALPCMLYRFGSGTPLWQLFNPVVALLWLMCALLIITGVAWHARRRGAGWPDAAMGALVAAFPNSGFMGVPLILALLGQGGVGPVMGTLIIDLVVTTSLCIGLSQWGAADEHGAARAVGRALQGMLRNPMPWSILLGAAAGALGLQLWGPLGKTVQLLADAASPVALFTIGAVLARSQFQMVALANGRHGPRDVGVIAFTKLLVHPALVWGLGSLAVRGGWLVEAMLLPLVLAAALPAAGNVSLLAERFGADNGRIARVILWSTAVAFFSFSAVVALLR
ncbi:AEC family transporter [Ottowia sp.]|uniref:AEC family transporter n=1 Tax=Ottowia sp. TaxID=1898956 RepID=UPI001D567240|nr:AEC family transporter [Ottowia sp.]MCB1994775.1 AEC family transporter [Rhodoferax sp.]MCB2032389.1 AEC family transporter [Ottowia sp.]MCP5256677.1 AEC family transporter [Burkholderiaceae bacterium]HRW73075.1 AEC family transporter [Ottowia sp.]